MGSPKALLRDGSGQAYLTRSAEALHFGGCRPVVVVLGAQADRAAALLELDRPPGRPPGRPVDDSTLHVVVAADWAQGMGASLRAGFGALQHTDVSAALVSLVDLPDVGRSVVERVLDALEPGPDVLGRASYDGLPGHPVLIGRDHWPGVITTAHSDHGAREYLLEHPPALVECGDLASGRDVDTPRDLAP